MTYCASDIHGEYDLFLKLLDKIKFSDSDLLIICGDIIDKGRHSIKLAKYVFNMPNVKCIAGNHEYAFLKYYWALMKESPTDFDELLKKLQNYFPYDGKLLDWETVDNFEKLPYFIEGKDFICVHAGVPLDNGRILPIEKATCEQLVYDRTFKNKNVLPKESKCVLFGHTPTNYICGEDKILAYKKQGSDGNGIGDYCKIHLDTGTWLNGVLGCFCIDNCKEYYVNNGD